MEKRTSDEKKGKINESKNRENNEREMLGEANH